MYLLWFVEFLLSSIVDFLCYYICWHWTFGKSRFDRFVVFYSCRVLVLTDDLHSSVRCRAEVNVQTPSAEQPFWKNKLHSFLYLLTCFNAPAYFYTRATDIQLANGFRKLPVFPEEASSDFRAAVVLFRPDGYS